MHTINSLIIFLFLCIHACIARYLPLVEKDFPPQHISAKMIKVVSLSMHQEDTNGRKSVVERNDHSCDKDSVIPRASNTNDSSQKEKLEDHRGSEIDESLSGKRFNKSMSPKQIDQSTSQSVMPYAKQAQPEGSKLELSALSEIVKERLMVMEMDYNPPQKKTPIHNK